MTSCICIFELVSALGYAEDLKLFMTINNLNDFLPNSDHDLDRVEEIKGFGF
jgi:hypothetical protein